jgi:hypothetical protein
MSPLKIHTGKIKSESLKIFLLEKEECVYAVKISFLNP